MRTILALLALVACDAAEEDPVAHACEQVGEGSAVSASAAADGSAGVGIGEDGYQVALVSGAVGYLRVSVTEDTAATLLLDTADVVTGLWHDGVEATLPQGAPADLCAEAIPEHFDLDLAPGDWDVALGPAAVDSVWLMLVSSEGHAD